MEGYIKVSRHIRRVPVTSVLFQFLLSSPRHSTLMSFHTTEPSQGAALYEMLGDSGEQVRAYPHAQEA